MHVIFLEFLFAYTLQLSSHTSINNGAILYVVGESRLNNVLIKNGLTEAALTFGITTVDFVGESRSSIISKMTLILEKRIFCLLQTVKAKLLEYSCSNNVETSLLEVNAVLKRLTKAESYPNVITEDAVEFEMETGKNEVIELLKRSVS